MLQRCLNAIRPSKGSNLGKAFSRLGWIGFWLQVVFGSLPIVLLIYFLAFSTSGSVSRSGIPFIEYLVFANLLLLFFTAFWSYRYTRLGRRLLDPNPERRPSETYVMGVAWTGVVASTVGMLFSMIVIVVEAANMMFFFLRAPQGGIPVVQTSGAGALYWVSSVDMVSLTALILALFGELIVLVISLWLLFRATLGSPEVPAETETGEQQMIAKAS